jgi:8-oxo-dGTP diphosphatase
MEVQVAVCGLILRKGKVLILRRAAADEFAERGFWTLPGGRVEVSEPPDDAVVREVKEETGLHVEVLKPINVWSGTRGDVWRIGIDYLCKAVGGAVKLSAEHDDYAWATLSDLGKMWVEDWVKETIFLAEQETARNSTA